MERVKLTDEQIALWKSPTIAEQLPVLFDTGFRFTEATGHCAQCRAGLPNECMHGNVLRPTPHVADIVAMGYCDACKLLTPFRFRVYDDERFTTLRNDGWYEGRMRRSRADRIKARAKSAIRWLFTF